MMQSNAEQMLAAAIDAVRAQVLAELKTQVPAAAPRRVFRRDRLLELKAAAKSWEALSRELGVPVGTSAMPCQKAPPNQPSFLSESASPRGACAP